MRLIDADAFEKTLESAEIKARQDRKYVFESAINTIRGNLRNAPSVQPEQIARDIATIIENEQDMRVILKNAEHTETHSCDCISREAAIHLIAGYNGVVDKSVAKRLLIQMPSAQPEQRWIPTSERQPKVREWVLCQCRAGIMDVLRLPEAYKGGSEE